MRKKAVAARVACSCSSCCWAGDAADPAGAAEGPATSPSISSLLRFSAARWTWHSRSALGHKGGRAGALGRRSKQTRLEMGREEEDLRMARKDDEEMYREVGPFVCRSSSIRRCSGLDHIRSQG
ncbi:hypothetical protein MPTK1_8g08080 [Marchantia polymorpha subsp. ruderalis]|nr:hypothetical protein Mp_8g08080 [Marchantia polymorpha subsp. ruderalis]